MPNRRIQDEIRYCDRCGISFLWSVEEQRAGTPVPDAAPEPGARDAGQRDTGPRDTGPRDTGQRDTGQRDTGQRDAVADAPRHCAGCRALLPAPGRERGMVKWYSLRKRYGFLVRRDQAELFVPATSLQGTRILQPGDLVEFSLGANEQGPMAEAARLVASAAQVNVPLAEVEQPRLRHNPAARSRRV